MSQLECILKVLDEFNEGSKSYSTIFGQIEADLCDLPPFEALKILSFLERTYPDSPEVAYLTATILHREEQYRAALQTLLMIKRRLPHEPLSDCTCNVPPPSGDPATEATSSGLPPTASSRVCWSQNTHELALLEPQRNSSENQIITTPRSGALDHTATSDENDQSAISAKAIVTTNYMRDPRFRALHAEIVNVLLPRWHFPMLNDAKRNLAFKRAIENAVGGKGSSCLPKHDKCIENMGSWDVPDMLGSVRVGGRGMQNCEKGKHLSEPEGCSAYLSSNTTRETRPNTREKAIGRANDTGTSSNTVTAESPTTPTVNVSMSRMSVMDIGCGTGLLSVYAARAGAGQVWGCDTNEVMCEMADGVCADNLTPTCAGDHSISSCQDASKTPSRHDEQGSAQNSHLTTEQQPELNNDADGIREIQYLESTSPLNETKRRISPRIQEMGKNNLSKEFATNQEDDIRRNDKTNLVFPKIINLHSNDISVQSDLLGERVELVVTETLDGGLLGEGIMDTLIDAWGRLLLPTAAPSRALKQTGRVIPGRAEAYACLVECEYICRYTKCLRPSDLCERLYGKPVLDPCWDVYNTERLEFLPGGYTELSRWYKVFEINFNSFEDLKSCAQGEKAKYFSLRCDRAGRLDAVALAFKLFVDEENVLESFPNSGSCWETTVYPERRLRNLEADETVIVKLNSSNGLRMKTVKSRPLQSILNLQKQMPAKCRECVSEQQCPCQEGFSEILVSKINQKRKRNKVISGEAVAEDGLVRNLDDEITPDCPDPGLFLDSAQMKAFNSSSYITTLTTAAKLMAQHLRSNRKISNATVSIFDETPLPIGAMILIGLFPEVKVCVCSIQAKQYLLTRNVQADVHVLEDPIGDLKDHLLLFDAMFMWPVTEIGLLQDIIESRLDFCRQRLAHSGAVFPASLSVLLTTVSSPILEKQTRVQDTNTHGVKLESLVNMLQTTHQLDALLDSLPHRQLTPVVSPLSLAFPSGTVSRHPFPSGNHEGPCHSVKNKRCRANYSSQIIDDDGLYSSGEGWDCPEGREVIALHERGLLCSGLNLFESEVRVKAVSAGTVTGLGQWFGLRGITCRNGDGKDTVLGVSVLNKSESNDNIAMVDSTTFRNNKSYIQQSIEIFNGAPTSQTAGPSERNTQPLPDDKYPEIQGQYSSGADSCLPALSTSPSTPIDSLPASHAPPSYDVSPTVELFTIGPESPCGQTCFMQPSHLEVRTGDRLSLECVYRASCFWAEVRTADQHKD